MEQGGYKNYYIAFLDVLGFKNLVNNKENSCKKILDIYENFKNPVTGLYIGEENESPQPVDSIKDVNIKVMSDSICFYIDASVPNALLCLLACCGSFQCKLLSLSPPILIRGAITVGEMYAEGDTTFGPALTEAYLMEEKSAKYPRIIITKQLVDQGASRLPDYVVKGIYDVFLFRDDDGFYSVNFLGIIDEESLYRLKTYVSEILDSTTDSSIREKHLYLDEILKSFRRE